MEKIKGFILRTKLANRDFKGLDGNSSFDTKDYVYLESCDDYDKILSDDRVASSTDYARINLVETIMKQSRTGKNGTSPYWLRSGALIGYQIAHKIQGSGNYGSMHVSRNNGVRVALHLDLKSIVNARSVKVDFGKIEDVKDKKGNIIYHTIEFGEYPQAKAPNSEELETLYLKNRILHTGKKYTAVLDDDGLDYDENLEYEYRGKKYVRVKNKKRGNFEFSFKDEYVWCCVEPIKWEIKNWDEMPQSINPQGDGSATYIDARTEEIICPSMPFNPFYQTNLWQNSLIRAYLNGYDLYEENSSGNGDIGYIRGQNIDCRKHNFLDEAFSGEFELKKEKLTENVEKKISNPYGFVYSKLSNDDLLKAYVQSNTSVFLHGPSGVGKSERVKELDPTATRISLRPQMNPEEVDGTLDRETGDYIPPLWYKQLTEKCNAEPNRKHILFIDELTNVKPTVQSLVYSIVLDRAGKEGLWKLPENAVVVAAGNETAGNLAAYPLTNALFRRFSHIYYEVNKEDWLDWALDVKKTCTIEQKEQKIAEPRAKVHPAIIAYIMSRQSNILYQELDEENPAIVIDPRKWKIASEILYATKNPQALEPAIGYDLTADFTEFTKDMQLSVEDVMKGHYNKKEYQEKILSEKYAIVVGLVPAKEEELKKVRTFIQDVIGKEMLASFDSMWIRNDPERAEIIAECQAEMKKDASSKLNNENIL